MSPTTPSSRFLGMDLHTLWLDLWRPWKGMQHWPALAWLTPDMPVRVLQADGRETIWLGDRGASAAKAKSAQFEAVELPDELLLRRGLIMPAMTQEQIAEAVSLEIRSASPFALADLVWGYVAQPTAQGGLHVDTVFASRNQAAQYLEKQRYRLATPAEPEVWAFTLGGKPIVLAGWGEARRVRYGAMRRRVAYVLLSGALFLAAGIAVTPIGQLRLRAVDATHAYEDVQQRTLALVGQREAFVRSVDQLQSLNSLLLERVDLLQLIETLTKTLPDDTFLQTLQVQGVKVTINGLTTNAATLMQLLGAQPGFKEVRAPSAATRNPGANAENFIIEFQLDPAVLSVAAGAPAASVSVPLSQTASQVVGAPTSNTMPASPAPSALAPRKSRFSSGPEGPATTPVPKTTPPPAASKAAQ